MSNGIWIFLNVINGHAIELTWDLKNYFFLLNWPT